MRHGQHFLLLLSSVCFIGLAHSPGPFGVLIFLAYIPFFKALQEASPKFRMFYACMGGWIIQFGVHSWIGSVTWAGVGGLALYHSFFLMLWCLLTRPHHSVLWQTLIWVGLEVIRENLGPGSPFGSPSECLADIPSLIQPAAWGGSALLSFWIIGLNGAGARLLQQSPLRFQKSALCWLLVLLLPWAAGFWRLKQSNVTAGPVESIRLGLVQPNIPPLMKWDPSRLVENRRRLINMTEGLAQQNLDMVIWPESALLNDPRRSKVLMKELEALAGHFRTGLLLGTTDEMASPPGYYNSAFLLRSGKEVTIYNKIKLVPFGETIPLVQLLPFLKHVTPIPQSFLPGNEFVPMRIGDKVTFNPLICFEDTLSLFVRNANKRGPDFLVTLTNDGWFPGVRGPTTHARLSSLRAVENGVPILRCANTGISAWVDAFGRTRANVMNGSGKRCDIQGTLVVALDIPARRGMTFYGSYGPTWLLVGILIHGLVFLIRKKDAFAAI